MQPHRFQKLQAAADLVDNAAGDLQFAIVEFPGARRQQSARERHGGEFGDRKILHAHRQAGRPQPLAVADGHGTGDI